ncbi:hypothetical protein [Paenibacillus xerothermodurans]|uniref:Uncharacterized protein n=1 Tax=Paenibacillus xerothermodurans TaxID=1977292 RepID=A0A2W1NUL4_PAEXE|nr:hypothetical protein [Paenibacillus xerothermodurans]PZE19372.1 hypothetical protein CBW46_018560 [Paenibacillus xerothermodurans]
MKKRTFKVVLCTVMLWTSTVVIAVADGVNSDSQAGSIEDPVITKSYFEQNIQSRIAEELHKQSVTEDKVKQMITKQLAGSGAQTSTDSASTSWPSTEGSNLTVVTLEPGQVLMGAAGSEIIVRTGKVTVTSSDDNGIPDITSGKDISAGAPVELNHLLVVPRDGRGVKADARSKQEIFVMVRGAYEVTNPDGSKATP